VTEFNKAIFVKRVVRFSLIVLPSGFLFFLWECSLNPGGITRDDYIFGLAVTAMLAVFIGATAAVIYRKRARTGS
jgi:hypothetical protein